LEEKIYTNTHASTITGGPNSEIITKDGFKVTPRYIIVATNVPVNDRVVLYTKLEPYRSYVITC